VLAVVEHLWGEVGDQVRRMTSALAGGVGCSEQELCGALSGGALIIGSRFGRTSADLDDGECQERVCAFRDVFLESFGTTCCGEIRASGYGSEGRWPCSAVVERAARLLLAVLADGSAPT
jgi:C_GCAxxG_C_C family probable redox protein